MTEQITLEQSAIIRSVMSSLTGLTATLCTESGRTEEAIIVRVCKATEEAELTLRGDKSIWQFATKRNAAVIVKATLRACLHELEGMG